MTLIEEMYLENVFPSYTESLALTLVQSIPASRHWAENKPLHSPYSIYNWTLFIPKYFTQNPCNMKMSLIPQEKNIYLETLLNLNSCNHFSTEPTNKQTNQPATTTNKKNPRCKFPGIIPSDSLAPFYWFGLWVDLFVSLKPRCTGFFIFLITPIILDSIL